MQKPPSGPAAMPAVEVTFTMAPEPRSRMPGRNAWIIRTGPKKLVSNARRTSAIGTSSTAPSKPKPALLTSTSTDPTAARTSATDRSESTSSSSVLATSRSAMDAARRAVATTSRPRAVSSSAVARPMPVEQPVTSAVV